jgi:hypothetical protein
VFRLSAILELKQPKTLQFLHNRYKLAKKKDNDRIEGKFLLHKVKEGNNENASRTKATVQLPFPATVSS